jgi:hypothetical protein
MVDEMFWILSLPHSSQGRTFDDSVPAGNCGSKLSLLANAGKATTDTAARRIGFRTKCGQLARIASAIVTYAWWTPVRSRA